MTPVMYLFCIGNDRISGTVMLRDDGSGDTYTPVNIVTKGEDPEALAEVYRQLLQVADDVNAPWNQEQVQ